ncbi:ATP-dependent DNA helicase [Trichonephila clavipes]|nr:ATP-dependent DNA helicase [Trichonephila clavipes]
MHEKSHAIIRLPVHLPNMQPVYLFDDEERQALKRAAQRNTMLTALFELNRWPDVNIYLYDDIPKHFVWKNNKRERSVRLGDRIVSSPSSPLALWEELKSYLCEDFEFHTSVHQSVDLAFHNIADQLHAHNMILMSIGLPEPATLHAYVETDS